jgi:hypothetical protein
MTIVWVFSKIIFFPRNVGSAQEIIIELLFIITFQNSIAILMDTPGVGGVIFPNLEGRILYITV